MMERIRSNSMVDHNTTYKEANPNDPVWITRSTASGVGTKTKIKEGTNTDTGRRGWNAHVCVVDRPGFATEGDGDTQLCGTGYHMNNSSLQKAIPRL
jgi:hypothetical protein